MKLGWKQRACLQRLKDHGPYHAPYYSGWQITGWKACFQSLVKNGWATTEGGFSLHERGLLDDGTFNGEFFVITPEGIKALDS